MRELGTVVVTGGSSGLGAAVVEALSGAGAEPFPKCNRVAQYKALLANLYTPSEHQLQH